MNQMQQVRPGQRSEHKEGFEKGGIVLYKKRDGWRGCCETIKPYPFLLVFLFPFENLSISEKVHNHLMMLKN